MRKYKIGMPQMSLSGLSENWIIKEMGDLHWELVSNCLQKQSHKVLDKEGNRLHSTIIGLSLSYIGNLDNCHENDTVYLKGNLSSLSRNKCHSKLELISSQLNVKASMLSSFAAKSRTNTKLTGSIPIDFQTIPKFDGVNDFYGSYKEIRQDESYSSSTLFEMEYNINPFNDINGVNLLYFASYTLINDYCENEYFRSYKNNSLWPFQVSIRKREVFYLGNCNHDDRIIYKLHRKEFIDSERLYTLESRLYRKSDFKCIAKITTKKEVKNRYMQNKQEKLCFDLSGSTYSQ